MFLPSVDTSWSSRIGGAASLCTALAMVNVTTLGTVCPSAVFRQIPGQTEVLWGSLIPVENEEQNTADILGGVSVAQLNVF